MTRPISVEIIGLIRGNVTAQQLLTTLQEQADKNGAYILLGDGVGDIVRQLDPLQPEAVTPITLASGTLPHGITAAVQGKFTTTDGRTFLYAAYPLNETKRPIDQSRNNGPGNTPTGNANSFNDFYLAAHYCSRDCTDCFVSDCHLSLPGQFIVPWEQLRKPHNKYPEGIIARESNRKGRKRLRNLRIVSTG